MLEAEPIYILGDKVISLLTKWAEKAVLRQVVRENEV